MPIGGSGLRADVINASAVITTLVVSSSAAEAKVGASRLSGRQELFLYNASNRTVYWSPDPSVTTSTGIPFDAGEALDLPFGDAIAIYVIADTGSNNVIVMEMA